MSRSSPFWKLNLAQWIQGSALALSLFVVVLAWFYVSWSKEQALEIAGSRVQRVASATEVDINRTLVGIDLTLVETADWLRQSGFEDVHLRKYIRASLSQNLLLRDIVLIDEAGTVLLSGRSDPSANDFALSLPPGFLTMALDPGYPAMRYSTAVVNPLTSQPVWFLSRAVTLRNGARASVMAEVQLSLLSAQIKPDHSSDGLVVTLEDRSGDLITSYPARASGETRLGAVMPESVDHGVVIQMAGRLDDVPSLVVSRPGLYPGLIVSAGMSQDLALERWHKEKWFALGICGMIVLVSAGLSGWASRTLKRMAQARSDLRTAKMNLSATLAAIPDHLLEIDAQGLCLSYNRGKGACFYAEPDRWVGHLITEVMPALGASRLQVCLNEAAEYGYSTGHEFAHESDHDTHWFELSIVPKTRLREGLQQFVVTARNITDRKQTEKRLRLAANVFNHAQEGIMITDPEGVILDVNDTLMATTGYARDELLGKKPSILNSGRQTTAFFTQMWHAILRDGHWSGEVWNRSKNGQVHPVLKTISAVHDAHGNLQHFIALYMDITQIKQQQQQLERVAHFDVLTGLPNRVLLTDLLRQALSGALHGEQSVAVVYLDLDDFKQINDAHGHHLGDELLLAISKKLRAVLRPEDTLARIGGDEFVAVLSGFVSPQACESVLHAMLSVAAQSHSLGEVSVQVSASAGVAFSSKGDIDPDHLIRRADQAMYMAKDAGKNRWQVFDTESALALVTLRERLRQLREALARGEFVLHYQPKVNLRTGKVVGVEALIRWNHPIQGLLPPSAFLPLIEDHAIGIEFGEWVIRSALLQTLAWRSEFLALDVSVNIGAQQLQQQDFPQRLQKILFSVPEADPRRLQLEVLETKALEDMEVVAEVMKACKALGVSFALDDFGTGYSSLTYLRRLPVNTLKIDQTFVRDMLFSTDDRTIVESVLGLAKLFDRTVVAEGVETGAHGEQLLGMGCELAQGFGIAKPMPAEAVPDWVRHWHQTMSNN